MTFSSREQLTYGIGQGLLQDLIFFHNKHEMFLI